MAASPATGPGAPGILYYDPNPTTAKLATATLRLAGFEVFNAGASDEAVKLCSDHGPAGDSRIVALLLDASADPKVTAAVLRELVQLPGASELPGILMVSRKNPNPIPGAESLPTIRRPFSSPALLKVVNETLTAAEARLPHKEQAPPGQREAALTTLLARHFPEAKFDERAVSHLLAELDNAEDMPTPAGDETLQATLNATRLEAILELLASNGSMGIVRVEAGADQWGKLHISQGRILLGEHRGTDEDLKFGRFVVEGGYMQDAELEAFIVGKDPEGRPLGTRLVDGGFLSEADLASVLAAQSREVTCHLLTWREGHVTFRPSDALHPLAVAAREANSSLLIGEALLEGLRRLDERAEMGPHMPSLDEVFVRNDEQIVRLGRQALSREELTVLELTNGRNSVKEIARRTRSGTFSVSKIMYRMVLGGVVRRRVDPVAV